MRLLPQDRTFFDMFASMADALVDGAKLLEEILSKPGELNGRIAKLKEIEHRGDDIIHAVMVRLNKTFITPLDREDIHALVSALDDVLDFIYGAGERLMMYKIPQPPVAAAQLAALILHQTEQLRGAVNALDRHEYVLNCCVEINRLENEADAITRAALAELFDKETNPITLIKLKELYETLEMSTDKAEDAADVLQTIVLKNS